MAKQYDITIQDLLERFPGDVLRALGIRVELPVVPIESELATVSVTADKVFRTGSDPPSLLHVEAQAQYDKFLSERVLRYNVLLAVKHRLPVQSVVVLVRPAADGPAMTGQLAWQLSHDADPYLTFRYEVVRLWELPVAALLSAGIGALPLTPLTDEASTRLPDVLAKVDQRIQAVELQDVGGAQFLQAATYILLGLRYSFDQIDPIFPRLHAMEESSTYQAIIAKGRAKGRTEGRTEGRAEGRTEALRETLLELGERRFGEIPGDIRSRVGTADEGKLHAWVESLLDAASWDDLLNGSA